MSGLCPGGDLEPADRSLKPEDLVPLPSPVLTLVDFSCGLETIPRNSEDGFFVIVTCADREAQYKVYYELRSRNYKVQIYPDRRDKPTNAARIKKK